MDTSRVKKKSRWTLILLGLKPMYTYVYLQNARLMEQAIFHKNNLKGHLIFYQYLTRIRIFPGVPVFPENTRVLLNRSSLPSIPMVNFFFAILRFEKRERCVCVCVFFLQIFEFLSAPPKLNSEFFPENSPAPNRKGLCSNHLFLRGKLAVKLRWGYA